ncbi:MAG TPA: NlpC/P60 family protein [Streptosporangiaceae bacterium]|nr:NlpC/P60 family protein [Streptosporangiaceae bacterium]
MQLTSAVARRARRRPGRGEARRAGWYARARRVAPALAGLLALSGTAAGAVLATAGPPRPGPAGRVVPGTRPAVAGGSAAVVPLLGRDGEIRTAVPAARGPAAAPSRYAPVAPLRRLRQADLLVVAPFSLSGQLLAAVSHQPAVTGAEPVEAAKVQVDGAYVAVLGVDPSAFRGYAAPPTAASTALWQGVADGGIAVSYTMGTLDRLSLGGRVTVAGRRQERLPVVAFGTVGIGGVDAVVSDQVARSLGMPASNALVISAPPASVASLAARIKTVLPHGAAVEPLVALVTAPARPGTPPAGTAPGGTAPAGAAMTAAQLTVALRAAESRVGLPYVWGAAGPRAFDCSGLVQWSFAQAGVRMPRVAADQARTGPAVPVGRLQPGDLLFYHTDPTAPGYISHVAVYLGNGWMIQAPQPGMAVQVVPANFGPQFAGAVRVYPQLAAEAAAGPA